MAALKDDQKVFIVQALACFDSPRQVIELVKQEFGVEVSPQQLQAYNPATKAGSRMSAKLKAFFESTREQFLATIGDVPIANQAVRLRALGRLYERVERQGNVAMATQILEQAAKETGGIFTNKQRHEMTGANGGPIQTQAQPADLSGLSDEELAILAKLADSDKSGD